MISTPSIMNVEEAANWAAKVSGETITPRAILALGEDGGLPIYAIVPETTTFLYPDNSGDRLPLIKGNLAQLTVSRITQLLATGEALLSEFIKSYADGTTATYTTDTARYSVPSIKIEDCRLAKNDVSKVALSIALHKPTTQTPTVNEHIGTILSTLERLGYDKSAVKRGGKVAAMYECIERGLLTEGQFTEAWKRASKLSIVRHATKKR